MPRRSSLDIPPIISFEEASSKASSSLVAPPSNLAGSMASSTSGPDHHHGTRPVTATPHDDDDDEDVWGEHVMVPADHHEANIGALIDGCGVATAMPPASPGDASVAVEGGVESWATKASPMSSESPSSYTVNGRGVFQSFLPDELRPDAPTHRTSVILPLVPSATSPSAVIVSSAAPMETSGSSFSDPALCASGETHPRHQSSMSSNASDLSSLVSPSLRASAATAGYAATGVAGPLRGAFHAAQHQPPTLQPHRLSVPTHDWVMPSPTSASAGGGDGSNASVGVAVLPRSPLHSPSMELAPTMTSTASSHSLLHYLLPHTNSSFGAPHSAVRGGTSPSSSSAGIGGPATYSPLRSPVIAKVPRSPVDVDTPSMHELGRPMHNASPLHSRMSVTTQDIFDLVDKQLYLMRRGRSVSEVGDESFSMKDGVPHIASGGRSLFGGPLAAGRPASFLSTTSLTSIAGAGSSVASLADPSMFPSSSRASTSHSYVSTMLDRSHPGSQQTSFKRGDGAFAAVAATAGAKTPLHLQYLRLSHQSQPGSGNESHMEIMFSGVSTPFAYQRSPHDSDGRDGGAWPPAAGAASHASHGSQPQHVSIATITSSDNTKSSSQLTPMSATAAVPPAVTPSGGAAGAAATNRHRFPSWPYETVLSASVASNVNSQEKAESRSFTASSSVDDSGSGRAVSSVAAANAISGQRIETMAPAAASDVVDGAAPRTPLRRPSSSSTRDDHHHSSGGSNNVPNSSNAARRHSMVPRSPLAVEGDGQQVMVSASPLAYAPSSPEALQQNTPNIPHRAHDEGGAISVASPVITGGLARPQPPSTPHRSFGGRSTLHGTSSSSMAVLKNGEVVIPKPRPPQEHAYQRSRAGLFNGIDEDLIKHPDEFIAAVFRLRRRLISDIIDGERDDREHIAQSESSGRHNLAAAHHVPAKLHNMLYYSFTFGAPWDHDMTPEEEARRTIESVEEVERWSALQLEHTLLTLAQIEEFGRGNVISEYVQRYVTVRGYYETLFEDVLLQREGNFEAVADADQGPATPAALVMPTGVMDVPQPATDETKVVHNTPPATEHSPPPCAAENTNGYVSPLLLSKACAVTPTNRFPEDAMTVNDLEAEQTSLFQRIVDEESAAARNLTLSAQIEFIAAARREQRRHQCRAISESLARVVEMEEPASRREIETLWRDSRNTKAAPYLRQRYVLTMAAASIAREQQQDAPMHPVDLLDDSSSIRHEKHDAAFSSITTVASGPITLQAINPHAPLHFASVMVPHSAPSEDPHENSHGRCLQTTPATNQPPESMLGSFPAGDGAGGAGGMHDHTSGSDAASIEPTSDQNVAGLDGSPLGGSPAAARGSLSAMVVAQQQHHHNDNNLAHQDSIGAEASPSRAASFLGIDAFQSTSEGASRRVSPRSSEGGIDGVPTSPLAREGEEGYLTPAEKNYHPAVVEPQATALFQPAPLPASSLAPVFALTRSIPLLGHSLASLVNTTHRFPFDDAWFLLMLEVQKLKSKMVDAFCTGGGVQQQQGGGRQPQHHQQPRNNGGYRGSDAFGSSTVSSVAPFVAPLHAVAALFAGTTTPDDAELLTRYIANDGCGSPPAPAMPHNALSEDLFFPTKPATTYSTTSLTQKVAGGICMRGVLPLLLDVVMTRKLFVTHTGVEDNQHSLGHGSLHTNDTVLIRLGGAAAVVNGADEAIGAPSGPGILLVVKRDVSYVGGGSRLHQQQQHHSTIFIDRSTPQTPSGTTDAGSTSTQTFHGSTNTQSPALQNTQPGGGAVIGDVQQLSPNGSPWQTQQSTNTNHKEVSLQPLQHTVSNVSLVLFPRRHSTATAPTVQTQQQPAAAAPRVSLLPHQDAYLGEWKGGQRHGFGLYEYPTASSVTLPVSTNHNNNTTANRNNAFYLIFADADNPAPVVKDMYLGNWMNGKRHGAGYYVRVTQQNNNHSPQPPSPHASAGGVGGVRTHPVRWVTCVIYGEWLQDVLQKTTWYGVTESAGPCECV